MTMQTSPSEQESVRAFLAWVPHIHGVTHRSLEVNHSQWNHDYAHAIMRYRIKPTQDAALKQFRLNVDLALRMMGITPMESA